MKMGKCKNKPGEQITLVHAHQKMDEEKIFQRGMVDKKREFVKHKVIEQKRKTKTISLLLHNLFGI